MGTGEQSCSATAPISGTPRSRRRWAIALATTAASMSLANTAQAANVTVGSPLTASFKQASVEASGTLFNSALVEPGAHITSPVSGAIVRWRIVSGEGGPFKLRVLRPVGGTTYTAVGTSSPQTPSGLGAQDFPTTLPIQAGDAIGIDTVKGEKLGAIELVGAAFSAWIPPLAEGSSLPYLGTEPGFEVAFNAEVQPRPAIASVSPGSGSLRGKTTVTITGTDFTGASTVSFGATPASGFAVDSESQITAVSPAGKVGATDIAVTTVAGTTAAVPADKFTYKGCVVPNLAGKKLKKAKRRLKSADCKLGQVKRKGDTTAKTGKVVKQKPKAGKQLPPGTKITVTLAG